MSRPIGPDDAKGIQKRRKELIEYFEILQASLGHPEVLADRLADPADRLGAVFQRMLAGPTRRALIDILNGAGGKGDEGEAFDAGDTARHLATVEPMSALLSSVNAHKAAGHHAAIERYVLKYDFANLRLKAALQVVNLQRGASLGELQLLELIVPKLAPADQHAIFRYLVNKSGTSDEEVEGVLAMVAPGPDMGTVVAITRMFPKPVKGGPWKPPGNQPIPFYIGNEGHKAIAEFYMVSRGAEVVWTNHVSVGAMLGKRRTKSALAAHGVSPDLGGAGGDLGLMPDIANMTTLEVYEIKPSTNQAGAEAEAAAYVSIFGSVGVPMKLGASGAHGTQGVVPGPGGHYMFWSPAPGAIVYQKKMGDYVPAELPEEQGQEHGSGIWEDMKRATGLSGAALVIYIIISEGSRAFPPRNLVPAP